MCYVKHVKRKKQLKLKLLEERMNAKTVERKLVTA